MAYDKFLIAPFESGLVANAAPFLLPEDAFQQMSNAYVWRGRVKKRFGSRYIGQTALNSRFRILLKNTDGPGATAGNASGVVPGIIRKAGQAFSIGTEVFTVYNPAGGVQVMYSTTGVATTHTFNLTTGDYNFVAAAPSTPVYFYPSEPVMGLYNWENGPVNDHPLFGFDTQFCYEFSGNAWTRLLGSTTTPTWQGNNSDFFWTTNWLDLSLTTPYLFVSNFNAQVPATATDDPMYVWFWTGAAWDWKVFKPIFTAAGKFVKTAKIILPFKDHMILLNTIENDGSQGLGVNTAHPNRCRYSINGSPFSTYSAGPPMVPAAWYEIDEVGYGGAGWIDATTDEAIIGAEFIKDRLIVYFERSTWELVYTGSPKPPFIWQKLNSELGTQSTYSTVIFDKVVLSIGNTGVHACNGINVERVDDNIPDDIFNIRIPNDGVKRVAGIRDYQTELVYWSWPTYDQDVYADVYPKKILVYNYKNGTWAYNDDVITFWGYFEQQTGLTWADITWPWSAWNSPWNSGVTQAQSKRIVAGNQQGFTFIVDPDIPINEYVMQVTNASYAGNLMTLTIIDHTLETDDFISVHNLNGITISGSEIYQVVQATDANTVTVDITGLIISGTYIGGGTVARVSRIDITSKEWNPYLKQGSDFALLKMDFCVVSTADGEITVDYATNGSNVSMIGAGFGTNSILGTSILETYPFTLYPLESSQDRLWHPIYFQTQGSGITIRLGFTDAQMKDWFIVSSTFELQGILLYTKAMSNRLE